MLSIKMNNEDDFDFLIEENVEPFVTENKVIAINHHEIEEEEDDFRDPLPRNSIAHMSTIQYERDRPSVWNGFISLHAAPAKDIYKYDELKDALRNEYIDAIVSRLEDHEDELREITRENDRADANAPEHIPIGTILCGAYSREHFDRNSHDYIVTRHRAPPHRKIFVNLALLRIKPLANPEFVRGRHQYEMYGYSNRYYRKRRANRVIIDEWEPFGEDDMTGDNVGINRFRTGFEGCAILQTLRDPIWIITGAKVFVRLLKLRKH